MTAAREARTTRASALDLHDVEVVVDSTVVVGALIASTLAQLESPLTMPQWRALVLASGGGCSVSAIAADLSVHLSNASRLVERLVQAGLVQRARAEGDRRQVVVTLTPAGRMLHDAAMALRRERVEEALLRMSDEDRIRLVRVLPQFASAVQHGSGPVQGPDPR